MALPKYLSQNATTRFSLMLGGVVIFCFISIVVMPKEVSANSFYFGAGGGQSLLNPDPAFGKSLQVVDEHDSAYRLFVGYDVLDYLSIEAFYTDLGEAEISFTGGRGDIGYTALGLEGLAYFPGNLSGFSGFFKLGLGQLESKGGGSVAQQPGDVGLTGGLGVEYQWPGGIFLRADYSVLDAQSSLVNLSLAKRFGKRKLLPTQDTISDADSDGVFDSNDRCPATLPGSEVDEKGCTVVQQFTGVLKGVKFLDNSAELTDEAESRLNTVAEKLKRFPDIEVMIVGHTDSRATPDYNYLLSLDRARAVTAYLMKEGVSSNRLLFDGRGELQPIESNSTEAGREKNRRVEIFARESE